MSAFLRTWRRSVAVWFFVSSCVLAAAEARAGEPSAGPARVGNAAGILAVQTDAAPQWRLLGVGESLPVDCRLQAAAGAPAVIELPEGRLHVAPGTELRLDSTHRQIALEFGRIYLEFAREPTPRRTWRVTTMTRQLDLDGSANAEVTSTYGPVIVHLVKGKGAWGTTLTEFASLQQWLTSPLSDADRKRIERWTAASRPAQGLGQLLVKDAQSQALTRLDVVQYHVNVVLQPPVALVQIDQSFLNRLPTQTEGTFVLNLPRGASVSRFAMFVATNALVEGELIERQQATNVYETIRNQRRDPAILEQIGDNLFKMRVFPIAPQETKRILLDYTVPLDPGGGECQFHLPLFSDLRPIWDFRLTGQIVGPTQAETVVSPSHPGLGFSPLRDGRISFELSRWNYQPTSDFSLSFRQQAGQGATLRSYLAEPLPPRAAPSQPGQSVEFGNQIGVGPVWHNRAVPATQPGNSPVAAAMTYFLATIPPPKTAGLPADPPPSDVLIAVDTSSGARDARLLGHVVRMIMRNLRPVDRVHVACLDVGLRHLGEGWSAGGTPCTGGSPQAEHLATRFDQEFCLGGANLQSGLGHALETFDANAPQRRRLVVYVGTCRDDATKPRATTVGLIPGFGLTPPSQPAPRWEDLAGQFQKAHATLIGVAVGHNAPLDATIGPVARATGGLVFDVAGDLGARRELFGWLLAGMPSPARIVRVEVAGAAAEDLYYPTAWLPDRPLTVLGRSTAGRHLTLDVTTIRDGRPTTIRQKLAIDARRDDVFLGRLWAQRKLDQLRAEETASATQPPELRQRIIALSQEWSLLCPYTAFLVLESEESYQQWKIDRWQRRRYWSPPEAMQAAPTPPPWAPTASDAGRLRRGFQTDEAQSPELLTAVIRQAREALDAGAPELAQSLLALEQDWVGARRSADYRKLVERARADLRQQAALRALGPQRGLFDPAQRVPADRWQAVRLPFLAGSQAPPREFLQDHPYARQLLGEVRIDRTSNRSIAPSLDDLIDQLEALPGVNVVVDRHELEKASIAPPLRHVLPKARKIPAKKPVVREEPDPFGDDETGRQARVVKRPPAAPVTPPAEGPTLGICGTGRMSMLHYARFVLKQYGLVLVEEPNRVFITIPEMAESDVFLKTRIYPVADLLLGLRVADPHALANPYMDYEDAARKRIKAKLQRPLSLDFQEKPLGEAIERVAKDLDDTILVDRKELEAASKSLDMPVTGSWKGAPAKDALRWMLDSVELKYVIDGDTLLVTTPEKADSDEYLQTRLHSGCGLVCGRRLTNAEIAQIQQGMLQPPGFGGMGGMLMGGMGGFGGGMGMGGGGGGMMGGGGMGGMGGGMGGMGGGMGGMGGGMGGMGGGGGAMGGGEPGDAAVPSADAAAQGAMPPPPEVDPFSTEDDSALAEDEGQPPPPARIRVVPAGRRATPTAPAMPAVVRRWEYDAQTIQDMATTIVQPKSWDQNGGPGTITWFDPTFDFIVSADGEVHDQIEALFGKLRKMPIPGPSSAGTRPITAPVPGDDNIEAADFDTLMNTVTQTVMPKAWDSGGGCGTIAPERNRVALVVSQNGAVHDGISRLLTMLRRSRYELFRKQRPWEGGLGVVAGPMLPALAEAEAVGRPRLAELPAPKPEDLAALRVRRESPGGCWRACALGSAAGRSDTIDMRRSAGRLEIGLPGLWLRTEGDEAAIASSDYGLVELGNWGETVRQFVDQELPWLPHRSNEELARLFHVRRMAGKPGDAARIVRLQLVPQGFSAAGGTWLEMAFSAKDGLIEDWQSYVGGKPAARLRFGNRAKDGSHWQTVVLEDAAGKALMRWQSAPQPRAQAGIPALAAGWNDFLVLDRRRAEPVADRPFKLALAAMQKLDWPAAVRHLDAAAVEHPRHPLLLVLYAWCYEQDPGVGPRAPILAGLGAAAAGGNRGFVRFIGEGNLAWLSPAERYEVLALPPSAARRAADWENLIRAAIAAERFKDALAHVNAALAAAQPAGQTTLERLKVDLLLRLGRDEEAVRAADDWAARLPTAPAGTGEALDNMAELLAANGQKAAAERLLAKALAAAGLAPELRYRLLRRRAEVQQGMPRWQTLLEAAAMLPERTRGRVESLTLVLADLRRPAQAEIAAQLARGAKGADLRRQLLVKQVELTQDGKARGELGWQLFRNRQLTASQIGWLCETWNEIKQPERVIAACEQRLRLGKLLTGFEAAELAAAYRAAGRPADALRAEMADADPTRPAFPLTPSLPPPLDAPFAP